MTLLIEYQPPPSLLPEPEHRQPITTWSSQAEPSHSKQRRRLNQSIHDTKTHVEYQAGQEEHANTTTAIKHFWFDMKRGNSCITSLASAKKKERFHTTRYISYHSYIFISVFILILISLSYHHGRSRSCFFFFKCTYLEYFENSGSVLFLHRHRSHHFHHYHHHTKAEDATRHDSTYIDI